MKNINRSFLLIRPAPHRQFNGKHRPQLTQEIPEARPEYGMKETRDQLLNKLKLCGGFMQDSPFTFVRQSLTELARI